MVVFVACTIFGLLLVAFSTYIDFSIAIIGIIFIGTSCSFGECVMLGYLKLFPSEIVSGWGSGTGLAGLGGSFLYLLMSTLKFTILESFLSLIPLYIIHVLVFFFLLKKKSPPKYISSIAPQEDEESALLIQKSTDSTQQQQPATITEETLVTNATKEEIPSVPVVKEPISVRVKLLLLRYVRCFKLVWWRALNLLLVYYLEYVVSIGFANKSQHRNYSTSPRWEVRNAFEILAFCYSIGVLLSRSSVNYFKIKRVEIITLLQAVNFALWFYSAKTKLFDVWVQFISMIFVGLLGGASYINVYYLILKDKKMNDSDRELCVNLTAVGVTIGITAASVSMIIFDNTILKFD